MKRRPGTLLKIEVAILAAAKELHRRGDTEFYGYGIARAICDKNNARGLTRNGTVLPGAYPTGNVWLPDQPMGGWARTGWATTDSPEALSTETLNVHRSQDYTFM